VERFRIKVGRSDGLLHCTPEASQFGEYDVLCRGYIANRREVETEARRLSGVVPKVFTEPALFAVAYQLWGSDLARHVYGEFAVAIYDRLRGSLTLAHDELGILPLFYSESQYGIAAASHLDDLVVETGVGQLDEMYLSEYLFEQRHFGEHTPYEHIRRVLPGEAILWESHRLQKRSVWTLGTVAPLRYRDSREYEAQLRETVTAAVGAALIPDAHVWCELSGGLDSSTVYAETVRSGHERAEAFSLIYPESDSSDEQEWIRPVLDRYPKRWHRMDADAAKPFTSLPDSFAAQPRIAIVTAGWDKAYDRLQATHAVDIVLTGQGGDAVFIGDTPQPYYLADLFRGGRWSSLWEGLRQWSAASEQSRPPGHFFRRHVLAGLRRHGKGQLLDAPPQDIPWLSRRFMNDAVLRARAQRTNAPPSASVADTWFLEGLLRSAHVVCSQYGERDARCRFHHPLLYRPLITFMRGVPWKYKLHAECDRLLQRRAYEELLPPQTILRRDKVGPDQAFYAGLASSPGMVECLTRDPRVVSRGYVDGDLWRMAVRQAMTGKTTSIRWFLATASLELWLRQLDLAKSSAVVPLS